MTALIEIRDAGLYCPAGDFYIDPRHPVPRAVITHAHGDHARAGCNHYWASARGVGLLRERIGRGTGITPLAYGERLRFGPTTVSLHSAGHILGSAQVRIEHAGEVWVVTGDFKRVADPSCDPFEVVRCDTLVTESTFALPSYQWPDSRGVIDDIYRWWRDCAQRGECALLGCYALGKAQRILADLRRHTDDTVYLHPNMLGMVRHYRRAGIAMLPTEAVGEQVRHFDWSGRLLLLPPGIAGTPWIRRFRPASLGFASGWMQVGQGSGRTRWDQGFILSDHADWNELLQTIADSGARRVLTHHGHGQTLIEHLRAQGLQADELTAPLPSRSGWLDAAAAAGRGSPPQDPP